MLTAEANERLTKVGAWTPMGELKWLSCLSRGRLGPCKEGDLGE